MTSIFKERVPGPVRLEPTNLHGDEQSDLTVHGGPDKAVCVYSADHLPFWRTTLGREDVGPGAFGENFTIAGLTELGVCLGDVFAIGTAVVQVSQPRSPCWKLGRKWSRLDLPKLVLREGLTGWYFRVLAAGDVEAGQDVRLAERPYARWTITELNRVAYAKGKDRLEAERAELAACPALSSAWRKSFREDGQD